MALYAGLTSGVVAGIGLSYILNRSNVTSETHPEQQLPSPLLVFLCSYIIYFSLLLHRRYVFVEILR